MSFLPLLLLSGQLLRRRPLFFLLPLVDVSPSLLVKTPALLRQTKPPSERSQRVGS